jgi:hypothetical protein
MVEMGPRVRGGGGIPEQDDEGQKTSGQNKSVLPVDLVTFSLYAFTTLTRFICPEYVDKCFEDGHHQVLHNTLILMIL